MRWVWADPETAGVQCRFQQGPDRRCAGLVALGEGGAAAEVLGQHEPV
ncbi:hypothetical protein [Streptomyces sp. BK022]|nr:hypothetical protein [Streptomyces sp. BK022]